MDNVQYGNNSLMIKSFEEYLYFIENELNLKLMCWQKEVLREIYNRYPYGKLKSMESSIKKEN